MRCELRLFNFVLHFVADLDYVSGVIGEPSPRPPTRPVSRFPPPGQFDDTSSSLFGHHFGTFFNGGFGFPGFQSLGGFGGFNTYTPWWKG